MYKKLLFLLCALTFLPATAHFTIKNLEDINPAQPAFALKQKVLYKNKQYTVTRNQKYLHKPYAWSSGCRYHTVVLTRPVISIYGAPVLEDTITVEHWKRSSLEGVYRNQSNQLSRDAVGVGGVVSAWVLTILLHKAMQN